MFGIDSGFIMIDVTPYFFFYFFNTHKIKFKMNYLKTEK